MASRQPSQLEVMLAYGKECHVAISYRPLESLSYNNINPTMNLTVGDVEEAQQERIHHDWLDGWMDWEDQRVEGEGGFVTECIGFEHNLISQLLYCFNSACLPNAPQQSLSFHRLDSSHTCKNLYIPSNPS